MATEFGDLMRVLREFLAENITERVARGAIARILGLDEDKEAERNDPAVNRYIDDAAKIIGDFDKQAGIAASDMGQIAGPGTAGRPWEIGDDRSVRPQDWLSGFVPSPASPSVARTLAYDALGGPASTVPASPYTPTTTMIPGNLTMGPFQPTSPTTGTVTSATVDPVTATVDPVTGATVDPVTGTTVEGGFIVRSPRAEAEEQFLQSEENARTSFQDFIQGAYPGATGFLQRGLEGRYAPVRQAFNVMSALGTLPGRVAGQSGMMGEPMNFRQFVESHRGVPTQSAWQNMLGGMTDWLTGERDISGTGSMTEEFMLNPENQFKLALRSTLQNVPYHLRPAAARTAGREFSRFMAQNPDRQHEWLPAWQAQRQRWNPELGRVTTTVI